MAKKVKKTQKPQAERADRQESRSSMPKPNKIKDPGYAFQMGYAGSIDESSYWVRLIPAVIFTAIVFLIVRMKTYERPMDQFYWSSGANQLTDFFSYYKMVFIIICAVAVIVFLLFKFVTQSLAIKRTNYYWPIGLYAIMILLSFAFSEYKEFAWLGWNDRFEGTAVLLSYLVVLFYIINTVNTEENVKWIVYPLAVTSAMAGILGLTQALDHDFFRTVAGQKMIAPNFMTSNGTLWSLIDQAAANGQQFFQFTFQNRQIYQTVYNINYVSFYLTLLIPLFGVIFINSVMRGKEEPVWKKIIWGALWALLLFNLIGSASSGGFFGMLVVVILAVVLLNARIVKWWKPVIVLLAITVAIGAVTADRWLPEVKGVLGGSEPAAAVETADALPDGDIDSPVGHLDFLKTEGNDIIMGWNGDQCTFTTIPEDPTSVMLLDTDGEVIPIEPTGESYTYAITDERFKGITFKPAVDDNDNYYIVIDTAGKSWAFMVRNEGVALLNELGKLTPLTDVPAVGFENNQNFGSGRGYIWSRTIPMMKDTMIFGYGADMYCLEFPHNDYVGKLNAGWPIYMIVDKPHNMYMGMWTNTGFISVVAFLAIIVMYAVQSFKVYFRRRYDSFMEFAGVGIFLGVMGFVFTGLVDDSSVSTMPVFYGLLGTGIAINLALKRREPAREETPAAAKAPEVSGDAAADEN